MNAFRIKSNITLDKKRERERVKKRKGKREKNEEVSLIIISQQPKSLSGDEPQTISDITV